MRPEQVLIVARPLAKDFSPQLLYHCRHNLCPGRTHRVLTCVYAGKASNGQFLTGLGVGVYSFLFL